MNRPCARHWAALLLALACSWGQAAPAPWPNAPFQYFAQQTPLSKVLADFTQAFGLRLELSPQVQGKVQGNYRASSPGEFLDTLGASYGLQWYYRDGMLYVSSATEAVSRSVRASRRELGTLKEQLTSLGVLEARFGWGEFPERGVILLSGPPAYVRQVVATITELNADASIPGGGREELRIFTLKHARAEDRTFKYRDQQVITPGIASILRGLMNGSATRGGTAALSVPGRRSDNRDDSRAEAKPAPRDEERSHGAEGAAVIEADQRLNAIIVRDSAERMQAYEALIRQLDVPTPLIEIEAMIVDVNSEQAEQLGVNWSTRIGQASMGFGNPSATPSGSGVTLARGNNINQANLLANGTNFFLAQIDAMARDGQARVLARPSVLTSDNLVAVLDLSQTLYLSVVGERVADLVPVATGTLLKVTPRVITEGGRRMVQLSVDIEDGSAQPAKNGAPPTVLQSTISTQALVRENDSLLIGGYARESDSNSRDSVPLLGQLPLVGNLFRNTQQAKQRSNRMFLIRPRILENPALLPFEGGMPPAEALTPSNEDAADKAPASTPETAAAAPTQTSQPAPPLSAAPHASAPAEVVASVPASTQVSAQASAPAAGAAPLAASMSVDEAAVRQRLNGWTQAWAAGDSAAYLSLYSSAFHPAHGLSLSAWQTQRRQRLQRSQPITVELEQVAVTLQGDTARVQFIQHYRSGKLVERSRKTLVWQRTTDGWQIAAELAR